MAFGRQIGSTMAGSTSYTTFPGRREDAACAGQHKTSIGRQRHQMALSGSCRRRAFRLVCSLGAAPGADARSLQDRSAFAATRLGDAVSFGRGEHFLHRLGPAIPIDGQQCAVSANTNQAPDTRAILAFHHQNRIAENQEGQKHIQHGLMFPGNQHRSTRNMLPPAEFDLYAANPAQSEHGRSRERPNEPEQWPPRGSNKAGNATGPPGSPSSHTTRSQRDYANGL